MITDKEIYDFVVESNKIEDILREPTPQELEEFKRFISLDTITIHELIKFVKIYQPNALIRDKIGLDVRVGKHVLPRGGAFLRSQLEDLLKKNFDAYDLHCHYELLHPFTDCNGRSGRALWAWKMKAIPLGFLRMFYYQVFENYRK